MRKAHTIASLVAMTLLLGLLPAPVWANAGHNSCNGDSACVGNTDAVGNDADDVTCHVSDVPEAGAVDPVLPTAVVCA